MIQIIPSTFSITEEEYQAKIEQVSKSRLLLGGWIHIDLMDGEFVPSLGIIPEIVKKYQVNFKKEAHLMVSNPDFYIFEFKDFLIDRFIIHLEIGNQAIDKCLKILQTFKNVEMGIALNPETEVSQVIKYFDIADVILLMSVNPGLGGQQFIAETIAKIKKLAALRIKQKKNFLIEVDGGINDTNIVDIVSSGADNLVIGSGLFKGDIDENLEKIWETLKS